MTISPTRAPVGAGVTPAEDAGSMFVPVFQGDGRLEYLHRPLPRLEAPDEVLVRIEACGICGTDLNILAVPPAHKAPAGIIIGHEGVGIVEAVGTKKVGEIREGQRRFPLVVRLPDRQRTDPEALAATLIPTATGAVLPLERVASISLIEGPSTINREWGKRRTVIQCNVRGRDVASFVADAQAAVERDVPLPTGYEIRWGGDFENLQSASQRLLLITPIVLLLIFLLLHTSFGSPRLALLIFLAVPMAASGGVFALQMRGMPFSISAGVGFIALFGVAVLNGLVWVSAAEQLRLAGMPIAEATRETAVARLRRRDGACRLVHSGLRSTASQRTQASAVHLSRRRHDFAKGHEAPPINSAWR